MAMPGKKPSLGILIGIGKPKKPGAGGGMGEMGDEMPEEEETPDVVAARAFMDAVKGDDPQAVVDTLKTLSDAIEESAEEESPEMGMEKMAESEGY